MSPFITSSIVQFDFKKGHSCAKTVFLARTIVENFTRHGSPVNLGSLDIGKAFDVVNHIKLYNKFLDKNVSVKLINILICWYSKMETWVRWGNTFSHSIRLTSGVRQGSVLAPSLFALYVDNLLFKLVNSGLGCLNIIRNSCFNTINVSADDLLLLSISLADLQEMINLYTTELLACDLSLNVNKSVCLRFGPRCISNCNLFLNG